MYCFFKPIGRGLLIAFLLFNRVSAMEHSGKEADSEGLTLFTALNFTIGYNESNVLDDSFTLSREYDVFKSLDFEAHLRWNGFFAELPGPSQQNVDGQFSGEAIGYNFFNSRHWSFDVYMVEATADHRYGFVVNDRRLTIKREEDIRVGFRATAYYDDYFGQIIITPISIRDEIGGFEASASARTNWQVKNGIVYVSAGLRYRSRDILDYYYGLSPQVAGQLLALIGDEPEAARARALYQPYRASSGVDLALEAGFEYPLTEDWVLGGFVQYSKLSNSISDSPLLFGKDSHRTVGMSLTYVF